MAEDGGVGVRRSEMERGAWLGIGQRVVEKRGDPWDLGCSIHPSARLSRCVPGELGSGDAVLVDGVLGMWSVGWVWSRWGQRVG